jgi:hypothetical protein
MITPAGPVLSEWSTGIGAFAELPEPDMTVVGDAHFRWARQRFSQDSNGTCSP